MDKKNYTIKTKLHSHNPKVVEKLIGGNGVLNMFDDVLKNIKTPAIESPFHLLDDGDFNQADPIVEKFMNMGEIGRAHV